MEQPQNGENGLKKSKGSSSTDEENEYQKIQNFTHSQPNHIRPSELQSFLKHVGRMYPTQFIVSMALHYNADSNYTYVEITTTGERFPGQYGFLKPGEHAQELNFRG